MLEFNLWKQEKNHTVAGEIIEPAKARIVATKNCYTQKPQKIVKRIVPGAVGCDKVTD